MVASRDCAQPPPAVLAAGGREGGEQRAASEDHPQPPAAMLATRGWGSNCLQKLVAALAAANLSGGMCVTPRYTLSMVHWIGRIL